jgi:hypothetical protein
VQIQADHPVVGRQGDQPQLFHDPQADPLVAATAQGGR